MDKEIKGKEEKDNEVKEKEDMSKKTKDSYKETDNKPKEKEDVKKANDIITAEEINEEWFKDHIYEIRGQKVMLDSDLAEIYGYTTKRLNEQVRNNKNKFDNDFVFVLSVSTKDFPTV